MERIPHTVRRHGTTPLAEEPKAELKDALVRIPLPHKSFAGYYDTTNQAVSDVENSLFTNMTGSLPQGIKLLRFERGFNKPPEPPTPIDLLWRSSSLLPLYHWWSLDRLDR
ncbi:hypothetical protein ABQE57_07930 [Mycolicibacterium elephantis]